MIQFFEASVFLSAGAGAVAAMVFSIDGAMPSIRRALAGGSVVRIAEASERLPARAMVRASVRPVPVAAWRPARQPLREVA